MGSSGGAEPIGTDTVQIPGHDPRSAEPPDAQLMTAAAHGDLRAFDRLVERHHGRAVRVAYRLCGDGDLARDLAQEGFLRILRAAGRYREQGRFTTYLYAVLLNLVRQEARRRRRKPESPLTGDDRTAPDRPDHDLDRHELARGLDAALAALPAKQRDVFVLSELEGLRYEEIAEVCGCAAGTVASRKHEATRRLRMLLADWR